MAVKIKIIRSIDYLSVSDDGTVDFEESMTNLVELAKPKVPPANYDLLLDFRRTQWILSTAEIFRLVQSIFKDSETFSDRIAMLVLPGVNFDKDEFKELCGQQKGVNIGTFTNYEDAVHWLYNE